MSKQARITIKMLSIELIHNALTCAYDEQIVVALIIEAAEYLSTQGFSFVVEDGSVNLCIKETADNIETYTYIQFTVHGMLFGADIQVYVEFYGDSKDGGWLREYMDKWYTFKKFKTMSAFDICSEVHALRYTLYDSFIYEHDRQLYSPEYHVR